MLFATEKNPKGPNLKQLEQIKTNLSGCRLNLSLPFSNMHSLSEVGKSIPANINIYDDKLKQWEKLNKYRSTQILNRVYNYSALWGQGVGTLTVMINIHCLLKKNTNLLSSSSFFEYINDYSKNYCDTSNAIIKDDDLKHPYPQDILTIPSTNKIRPLTYRMLKSWSDTGIYQIALSDDCHAELIFRYGTPVDFESGWYLSARNLEDTIISSLDVYYSDSVLETISLSN